MSSDKKKETSYPDLSAEMEDANSDKAHLDATSPTDSVIAGDFGSLSAEEQERQREEWKEELNKTEEEIMTLKQVLGKGSLRAISGAR
jgi:archaellum component FlaC